MWGDLPWVYKAIQVVQNVDVWLDMNVAGWKLFFNVNCDEDLLKPHMYTQKTLDIVHAALIIMANIKHQLFKTLRNGEWCSLDFPISACLHVHLRSSVTLETTKLL